MRAHGAAVQAYRAEAKRAIGLVVNLEPKYAVSERARRPHDPRTDRADRSVEPLPGAPGEGGRRRDGLDVTVHTRRDSDCGLGVARPLQRTHRVRKGDRKRSATDLDIRHPQPVSTPHAREDGGHLAVQGTADDRHSVERGRQFTVLLDVLGRRLKGRVGKRHHVRSGFGLEPESPREVRIQDVETA